MLQKLLYFRKLRSKLIFALKTDYYDELELSIPIGNDYWAQLVEPDAFDSFSEIFVHKEYLELLPKNTPVKIIDLGSHYGYFSLWLQSMYPQTEMRSLMVEPSSKCQKSLSILTEHEKIKGRFVHLAKGIGNPKTESFELFERPFMSSSKEQNEDNETARTVPIVRVEEIIENLEPPYDLIKCDVEGAEWEFLEFYDDIVRSCKTLILEWHSWHRGGGEFPQIESRLKDLGFIINKKTHPVKAVGRMGEVGLLQAVNQSKVS